MASPRPLPDVCRDRARSPRWNRSKIRSRSSSGTPGTVVEHVQPGGVRVDRDPQLHLRAGVGERVLEEVPHDPLHVAPVRADRGGRHIAGVDPQRRAGPGPRRLLEDHVLQVERRGVGRRGGRVGGRQDQEVADQPFHAAW